MTAIAESCRAVNVGGFYPERYVLNYAYAARMGPLVVERMAAASHRLAAVLNKAFSIGRQ